MAAASASPRSDHVTSYTSRPTIKVDPANLTILKFTYHETEGRDWVDLSPDVVRLLGDTAQRRVEGTEQRAPLRFNITGAHAEGATKEERLPGVDFTIENDEVVVTKTSGDGFHFYLERQDGQKPWSPVVTVSWTKSTK